ncbi:hypothetical protein GCM10011341_26060 [Frigidibacter albus]|nr:hypothetical protein GCM10011341_26060 [Frigidibacter albus]
MHRMSGVMSGASLMPALFPKPAPPRKPKPAPQIPRPFPILAGANIPGVRGLAPASAPGQERQNSFSLAIRPRLA